MKTSFEVKHKFDSSMITVYLIQKIQKQFMLTQKKSEKTIAICLYLLL